MTDISVFGFRESIAHRVNQAGNRAIPKSFQKGSKRPGVDIENASASPLHFLGGIRAKNRFGDRIPAPALMLSHLSWLKILADFQI